MPRTARQPSESDIYHVMQRGIAHSQLFFDDGDREAYLQHLERFKQATSAKLYAYCLMGNHVHLLLRLPLGQLSSFMKRLAVSYSSYFNKKYERSGYLFQERFKSEPVQSDEYFVALLRYIHNNPAKAGIGSRKWTSYSEYERGRPPLSRRQRLCAFAVWQGQDLGRQAPPRLH